MSIYSKDFYNYQMQGSLNSAKVIVPMVLDLLKPGSVIDIGCGAGTWLSIYKEHGIEDLLGVDGDYVDRKMMLIDEHEFRAHDLSKPFDAGRRYDLAQSLEVAEHLDQSCAEQLAGNLVNLSDIILFSAAVPFQLGTGHVNEQFADYWAAHFLKHGYLPVDFIRPAIWQHGDVEVCYRQNVLLFCREEIIGKNDDLNNIYLHSSKNQLSIIHPELYEPRVARLLTTLFEFGKTVQSNGNLKLAEKTYKSILDFNVRDARTWDALGQLAAQASNMSMAIEHIKRAIEISPAESIYHYNLGIVYEMNKNHAHARENYNKALELRPGDATILEALGRLPT